MLSPLALVLVLLVGANVTTAQSTGGVPSASSASQPTSSTLPSVAETGTLSPSSTSTPSSSLGPATTGFEPFETGSGGQESDLSPSGTASELQQQSTEAPESSSAPALTSGEPTPVTTTAFPAFTDKNDLWVENFLDDITIGYSWNSSNYVEDDDSSTPLPLNRTQFNLTGVRCEPLWSDIHGVKQRANEAYSHGVGTFRYFNACMALANFIYDEKLHVGFPSGFTKAVLLPYNVPYATDPAMLLAKNISKTAADFLHDTCTGIDCSAGFVDNPQDSPCQLANLYSKKEPLLDGKRLPYLSRSNVMKCQEQICSRFVELNVDDPDIGGVGVFLSYVFQILLAVILMICAAIDWFHCCILNVRRKDRPTFYFHSEPFVNLVTNFLKTQVFFVGALAIAAFVKNQNHSVGTLDDYLLLVVTINGVALLSFVLVPIYLLSTRSWYLYFISAAAYAMCLVFSIRALISLGPTVDLYNKTFYLCWDYFKVPDFLSVGDGNHEKILKDLLDYGPYGKLPHSHGIIIGIFTWCTVIMVGSLAHQLKIHKSVPRSVKTLWQNWPRPRLLDFFLGVVVFAVYLLIMLLNCLALYRFWKLISHTEWSFGQIIAVTIWVPVLADFINDEIQVHRERLAAKRRSHGHQKGGNGQEGKSSYEEGITATEKA